MQWTPAILRYSLGGLSSQTESTYPKPKHISTCIHSYIYLPCCNVIVFNNHSHKRWKQYFFILKQVCKNIFVLVWFINKISATWWRIYWNNTFYKYFQLFYHRKLSCLLDQTIKHKLKHTQHLYLWSSPLHSNSLLYPLFLCFSFILGSNFLLSLK